MGRIFSYTGMHKEIKRRDAGEKRQEKLGTAGGFVAGIVSGWLPVRTLCREAEGRFLRAMEQPAEITDVMGEGTADGDEETVTQKVAYLTFDDGPSTHSGELLDILKEENVKATFFVVGKEDEESREIYKRIVREGHSLDFILILTFIKRFTVPQTIFRQICGS